MFLLVYLLRKVLIITSIWLKMKIDIKLRHTTLKINFFLLKAGNDFR